MPRKRSRSRSRSRSKSRSRSRSRSRSQSRRRRTTNPNGRNNQNLERLFGEFGIPYYPGPHGLAFIGGRNPFFEEKRRQERAFLTRLYQHQRQMAERERLAQELADRLRLQAQEEEPITQEDIREFRQAVERRRAQARQRARQAQMALAAGLAPMVEPEPQRRPRKRPKTARGRLEARFGQMARGRTLAQLRAGAKRK